MLAEGKAGPRVLLPGAQVEVRLDNSAALVTVDGHQRYQEQTYRQNMFSLTLAATSTGVAAGNIVAAAAAASTNFALFNPASSGKLLVLQKFGMGIISGTPGAGPLFHGFISNVPTATATGTIYNNYVTGASGSVARSYATAAGTTLTGGAAPSVLRIANFSSTNTAQASVGELNAIEIIDGDIIVPPGAGWLPLWGAAGTSLLNAYSISWEEIPV